MSAIAQAVLQVVTTTTSSITSTQPNPLQLYLTGQLWELDLIMILPFAWVFWTKFLRNGFLLHFVIEEGESLREIQSKWFVPLDKEGQHLNLNLGGRSVKRGTKFTVFIDGRKVLFTDRFNKRHLIFPVNNVFAFHPFADEVLLPSSSREVINSMSDFDKAKNAGLLDKLKVDDKSGEVKFETSIITHITPIKINLVNTIRFDAIKLFKYFFGEAMIARVEASRHQNKPDKMTYILGGVIGALAVFAFVNAYPAAFGLQHTIPAVVTHITNSTTTTVKIGQSTSIITGVP